MNLRQFIFYEFLNVEIIILGVLLIALLGLFSSRIVRRFVILSNRMRLIYGYISVIFSVISLVIFGYFFTPFEGQTTELLYLKINPFSVGTYYSVSIGIILLIFLSLVETQFNSEKSYMAYAALLMIQVASYLILTSTTWLLIFVGFILVFTAINLYLRYIQVFNVKNNDSIIKPYTIINSISIAFLFIGLASSYVVNESFIFSTFSFIGEIWEYLSIIFVLTFLVIQIGVPPFHFLAFKQSETRNISASNILIIIQRGIALAFLVKYAVLIRNSKISVVLFFLFIVLGSIYTIWSSIATMTIKKLLNLSHYTSFIQIGIAFILLSFIFSSSVEKHLKIDINITVQALAFYSIMYIIIFSFSLAIVDLITKNHKTDDLELLRREGRNSIIQRVLIILSLIFQFVLPIFVGLICQLFSFQTFNFLQLYIISAIIIVTLLFTTVYLINITKILTSRDTLKHSEISSIEPGIYISLILSLFIIIGLSIFYSNLLEFCQQMANSLFS
ncbi:MAG: hypothetical protein KAS63_07565 [Candidatus Heimdallarchaeota archaeon]|nr:hypothetical protein [Candidatus Heimdallarchaeota archaeon]MCK4955206.1 hypothetical protein [Candidatus Heimdallarchaeota archaeon]